MNLLRVALLVFVLALVVFEGESWLSRRRRHSQSLQSCSAKSCNVTLWSAWSSCGNAGVQTRTRTKIANQSCGGSCNLEFVDVRVPCNRSCQNGGNPQDGFCSCKDGYTGRCCEMGRKLFCLKDLFCFFIALQ